MRRIAERDAELVAELAELEQKVCRPCKHAVAGTGGRWLSTDSPICVSCRSISSESKPARRRSGRPFSGCSARNWFDRNDTSYCAIINLAWTRPHTLDPSHSQEKERLEAARKQADAETAERDAAIAMQIFQEENKGGEKNWWGGIVENVCWLMVLCPQRLAGRR